MTTADLPPHPPATPPDVPQHPGAFPRRSRRAATLTVLDGARARRTQSGSGQDGDVARSSRRPAEVWDRHGASVYSMAFALIGDETAAEQAVCLGLTDLVSMEDSSAAEDDHRSWARLVFLRSQELVRGAPAAVPSASWFPHVAQLQRACVALCLFGGHTYREVAQLLDVPPTTVADLLSSGLRDAQHWSGGANNAIA